MRAPFSKNVTVPVSPDPVAGKTLAVSVVGVTAVDASVAAQSPTVVDALVTTTDVASAELGRKSGLPPYDAVTESDPRGSVVSSMLAELTPSAVDTTEVPSGLPLSMNDTDPSGSAVPDVGLTVAVSVTL